MKVRLLLGAALVTVAGTMTAAVAPKLPNPYEPATLEVFNESPTRAHVASRATDDVAWTQWTHVTDGEFQFFKFIDSENAKYPFSSGQVVTGVQLYERRDANGGTARQYQLRNLFTNDLTFDYVPNPGADDWSEEVGEGCYSKWDRLNILGNDESKHFNTGWKVTGSECANGESDLLLIAPGISVLKPNGVIYISTWSVFTNSSNGALTGYGAVGTFYPGDTRTRYELMKCDKEIVATGNTCNLHVEKFPWATSVRIRENVITLQPNGYEFDETATSTGNLTITGVDGSINLVAYYMGADGKEVIDYQYIPTVHFLDATPADWDAPQQGTVYTNDAVQRYADLSLDGEYREYDCSWQRSKSNGNVIRLVNPYRVTAAYDNSTVEYDDINTYYLILDLTDRSNVKTPYYPTPVKILSAVTGANIRPTVSSVSSVNFEFNGNKIRSTSNNDAFNFDLRLYPQALTTAGVESDQAHRFPIAAKVADGYTHDIKCVFMSVADRSYYENVKLNLLEAVKPLETGNYQDCVTTECTLTAANGYKADVDLTAVMPYGVRSYVVGAMYTPGKTEADCVFWYGQYVNQVLPSDITRVEGTGMFTDVVIARMFNVMVTRHEVEIYNAASHPGWVWVKNPYNNTSFYYYPAGTISTSGDTWLAFDITDPDDVKMTRLNTHFVVSANYGDAYMDHRKTEFYADGVVRPQKSTYSDNVITMPAGSIVCSLPAYDGYSIYSNSDFTLTLPQGAGVDNVAVDDPHAQSVYYNLQGIKVEHPIPGNIYIKHTGNKTVKVRF